MSFIDTFQVNMVSIIRFFFLYRILNTYAEENAVDDAIYYLGEALRREVIDLETFLKVREPFIKIYIC